MFLFKRNVDQSLLKDGMTIPKEAHQSILNNLSKPISRGENSTISIVIDGANYDAKLTWVNFNPSVSTRDVLQIRYTQNSAICQKLRAVFSRSVSAISAGESIADADKETIELLALGTDHFEIKCSPNASGATKAAFVKYIGKENDLSGYQRSYSYFRDKFKEAIGSVEGVRLLTPHSCRHTYVSQMQALGVDIQTIQSLVGHADPTMTEHYLHVQEQIRKQAVEKFSDAFLGE